MSRDRYFSNVSAWRNTAASIPSGDVGSEPSVLERCQVVPNVNADYYPQLQRQHVSQVTPELTDSSVNHVIDQHPRSANNNSTMRRRLNFPWVSWTAVCCYSCDMCAQTRCATTTIIIPSRITTPRRNCQRQLQLERKKGRRCGEQQRGQKQPGNARERGTIRSCPRVGNCSRIRWPGSDVLDVINLHAVSRSCAYILAGVDVHWGGLRLTRESPSGVT